MTAALGQAACVEDEYQDKYSHKYDSSPQAEVYLEVLTDDEDLPIGRFEFDHGLTVGESDAWRPANSHFIDKYEYPNRKGALPMINVDWYEAKQLCESQFVDLNGDGVQQLDQGEKSKRLCGSDEWKETCRGRGANGPGPMDGMHGFGSPESPEGSKDFSFPYGGNGTDGFYKSGWCNDNSLGAALAGKFSACSNSLAGTVHPLQSDVNVGWALREDETYVYDLTGNVWEWVDFDFYGAVPVTPGSGECELNDGDRPDYCRDDYLGQAQMLGDYYFGRKFANCNRSSIYPAETKEVKIGFRCCRD